MKYGIRYSKHVDWKRFKKLSKRNKERVRDAIEQKLMTDPVVFGKPMQHSMVGCRSLRIGEFRIIYRIEEGIVEILLFGHRSTVYAEAEKIL